MNDMTRAQTTPPPALTARLARLLPVGSLALGIASAVWMSRKPDRAPLIIGAALFGWVGITLAVVVNRRVARAKDISKRARALRWFALAASQTVVLQALVFPIPFFARALWPLSPQHLPFVVVYVAALIVGLWDPWYEKVAARPAALVALQGFAAFVASLTVLPIVGFTNTHTFIAAGVVVAVGSPLGFWLVGVGRHRLVGSVLCALVMACLVVAGAPLVPPAPLSLEAGTLCVSVVHRQPQGAARRFVAPSELVCHTAIRAPLGLRDQLVHVWSSEGRWLQTVALDVSGGAGTHGFRTWSRLKHPPQGRVSCRVETTLGQLVGVVDADVVP